MAQRLVAGQGSFPRFIGLIALLCLMLSGCATPAGSTAPARRSGRRRSCSRAPSLGAPPTSNPAAGRSAAHASRRSPQAPVIGFFGGVHGVERIGTQVLISWLHSLVHRLDWDDQLREQLVAQFPDSLLDS